MEEKLLSPCPSWSANRVGFCNVVRFVLMFCVSIIVLVIWPVSELYCVHCRKYTPKVEKACPSICLHFVRPMAFKLHLTLIFVISLHLNVFYFYNKLSYFYFIFTINTMSSAYSDTSICFLPIFVPLRNNLYTSYHFL